MAPRGWLLAALGATALAACGPGVTADRGLDASFRVANAQFVEGPIVVDEAAVGPLIQGISIVNSTIYPGVPGKSIGGNAVPYAPADGSPPIQASAVEAGMVGDAGHWIVQVAGEDLTNPGVFTFSMRGSFSPQLAPGTYQVAFRAVTLGGLVGPPFFQSFTLPAAADENGNPITAAPVPGAFVVALQWDTNADLDLHLIAPTAPDVAAQTGKASIEVWSKQRSTLPPLRPTDLPSMYDPDQIAASGVFDFDSNSQCVIDGRRNENVVWTQSPAPGAYEVRVDAFSMCGNPAAHWTVTVWKDCQAGNGACMAILHSYGEMTDNDTRGVHGQGAGLTVLDFSLR